MNSYDKNQSQIKLFKCLVENMECEKQNEEEIYFLSFAFIFLRDFLLFASNLIFRYRFSFFII